MNLRRRNAGVDARATVLNEHPPGRKEPSRNPIGVTHVRWL